MSTAEKFTNLPAEKQNTIIDAALASFGANGYKKSSISDIASAAGISKAMVFHYFGTKKALYLYLINLCCDIIINAFNEKFDSTVTDFFDRIKLATNIKITVIKKHPAILSFMGSVYFENDDKVQEDIQAILAKSEDIRNSLAIDGMDASKFKDGIDPKLVLKMLVCFTEGYVSKSPNKAELDLEDICREFDECMNLFKNNFYKEEYI